MGEESTPSGSPAPAASGSPLDAPRPAGADEKPRRIYQRPPRKGRIARWLAQLRCLGFGHVWRESRHFEDYETCTRCRARRRSPR